MDIDRELEQNHGSHHAGTGADTRFWGEAGAGVLTKARSTGRYLLLKRSPYVNEPNTWHMASGKIDIEDGETDPTEAALREFQEETGYSGPVDLSLVDVFEHGTFKFFNYYGEVEDEFDPTLNWESSDFIWADRASFPDPLHFGLRRILNLFENGMGQRFLSMFKGSPPEPSVRTALPVDAEPTAKALKDAMRWMGLDPIPTIEDGHQFLGVYSQRSQRGHLRYDRINRTLDVLAPPGVSPADILAQLSSSP